MPLLPLERVVLIDDDKFDNKYHARMIRRTGLVRDIQAFQMASDALSWFRETGVGAADIVFLDINMPGMDGFELLERAQAEFGPRFSDMVVMMLTTSLDPRDKRRAADFPVIRHFIPKSLTQETFVGLVAELQVAA